LKKGDQLLFVLNAQIMFQCAFIWWVWIRIFVYGEQRECNYYKL
jgi:hypothetical protein